MAELNKYIFAPIKTSGINILTTISNNFELIFHSLLPHSLPKDPIDKITIDSIDEQDIDIIYDSSLEIYKNSKERINSLESKAFNLMTYISAITAILFFLIDKDINESTKGLAVFSILVLIFALLISLRCIGIKTQKNLFIDSMFEFGENNPKSKNKKNISIELINNAIYNQSIADNTADILKSSRILLFYGIIFSSITFLSFIISSEKKEKTNKTELVKSKYIDSIYIDYSNNKKTELSKINDKIIIIEKDIEKIKSDKKPESADLQS